MIPAIALETVSFTYWQADRPALRDVHLSIPAGQFVVLSGPTGAGKSTFLKLLNGLIPHHIPGRLKGEVRIKGASTAGRSVAELSLQMGLVFEDPDTQIVSLTVEDDIAFGLSNLGLPADEIRERVRLALQQTRLAGFERRNPFTLSGGEKQSLALAGILAMRPGILALDEPTSMLDPLGRSRIISILKELAVTTNTTILIAEQNPELVMDLADRVLLFKEGQIVKDGTPQEVYADVEAVRKIGAKLPPVTEVVWELGRRGCWDGPTPFQLDQAVEMIRPKLRTAMSPIQPAKAAETAVSDGPSPIVDICQVEHKFDGEVSALKCVSMQLRRGEMTAIIGQNGSGKSTLAFHLVGILQPTNPDGRVCVDQLNVRSTPLRELIRHINYVFQNPDDQLFQETVADEILYGLKNLGFSPEGSRDRLTSVAEQFDLQAVLDQPPKSLSRGLRTKTAIAAIVAMQPQVLIVDEPTSGLDRREALEILETFASLAASGVTVIFITHEMDLVAQFAQHTIVMHNGHILSEGPPAVIFANQNVLQQASLSPPDFIRLAMSLGWTEFTGLRTLTDLAGQLASRM